ncbi:hypothetical protein [Alterinioella nitratireducens]|uniref:hypothetical protein n=1 Tax=Alterinioella nitratireducens TaxID=2735915 RepID=UPI0015562A7C|nr:hypothetical protein [Alterinioella nitratireducens]NPD20972.1 hypothetical protein [Alterinioella nitratireducens]
MNKTPNKVWRVGAHGNISRTLDVTPIGLHEQDFEGLSAEEASARRTAFLSAGSRFEPGILSVNSMASVRNEA